MLVQAQALSGRQKPFLIQSFFEDNLIVGKKKYNLLLRLFAKVDITQKTSQEAFNIVDISKEYYCIYFFTCKHTTRYFKHEFSTPLLIQETVFHNEPEYLVR
jgi:trimethylamine:corrinoid methyltransferase-like protein